MEVQGQVFWRAQKGKINLRILAYRPVLEPAPDGLIKVVIQVVEGRNTLIEDPVHVEWLPVLELARGLSISRNEGWSVEGVGRFWPRSGHDIPA